jgi:hypothetical protein
VQKTSFWRNFFAYIYLKTAATVTRGGKIRKQLRARSRASYNRVQSKKFNSILLPGNDGKIYADLRI